MTAYLDNAAYSFPKPASVVEAMSGYLQGQAANAGRGNYRAARHSTDLVEEARHELAQLIGAEDARRIIFTHHATDSLNAAIFGILGNRRGQVVTTPLEHNSVTRPLRHAGRDVTWLPLDEELHVRLPALEAALESETALVVMHHASNVLGCEQDVAAVGAICRARGVPLLLDAAQSAGVLDIDVRHMQVDLVALSAHKHLYGAGGIGVLYVREGLALPPWRYGGTGGFQSDVESQPLEMPWGYEAGTLNVAAIAGVLAGLRYVRGVGGARVRQHHFSLTRRLLGQLVVHPHITVLNAAPACGVVSFNLDGWEPLEVARVLDESFDIAVGAGLSCSPAAHRYLATFPLGAVRASVGLTTRESDVDALAEAIHRLASAEIYSGSA